MILSVSWRNIWRNKVRSVVIIISITLGICAGIFVWSFYGGMVNQRILAAIKTESSHIQLHHKSFLENPDEQYNIVDAKKITGEIRRLEEVEAVSDRILFNAMVSSAQTGSGIRIIGIDTDKEKSVTNLFSKITEGSYFENNSKAPVVVGKELAEKLSVRLGSKIVLTLQRTDGTITSGLFKIEGLYKTSNSGFDAVNVFVRQEDLQVLAGIEDSASHEIAVLLRNNEDLDSINAFLKQRYSNLDVKTWRELMPEVSVIESTMDLYMFIFMGIILSAMVFGIVNTMLMVVLERVKEMGMLMAIGMNKLKVLWMILMETVLLALTGGISGIMLGYLLIAFFARKGINLSFLSNALDKIGYDNMVYPVIRLDVAAIVTVMVLIAGILASVYPAFKALQLKPSEALRIDV